MNLAHPPPTVEAATADKAPNVGCAVAEPARFSEPAHTVSAPIVEPAIPVDDPRKFAPPNVTYPQSDPQRQRLDVDALRGVAGADFEAKAAVIRCGPQPATSFWKNALFPFLSKGQNSIAFGEVVRYVLVKKGSCFVFADKTDHSPLFAFPLNEIKACKEDPHHPHRDSVTISPLYPVNNNSSTTDALITVLLQDRQGRLVYQFTFDTTKDKGVVKMFLDVVQRFEKRVATNSLEASVQKGVKATS